MKLELFVFTAMLVAIVLHCIARYSFPAFNSVLQFVVAGALTGLVLLITIASIYGWRSLHFIAVLFLFSFFCELYVFLFTFVIGSVSAALLVKAESDSEGALAASVPLPATMVSSRLSALSRLQLIRLDGDNCEITATGVCVALAVRTLRRFFAHEGPTRVGAIEDKRPTNR